MSVATEVLQENEKFLRKTEQAGCALAKVSKRPAKKVAVVTCMDARLIDMLEPALGLARGDANIIKVAGNVMTDGFSDVVRSIMVSVYELGAETVLIVGHEDCGMERTTAEDLAVKMEARGVAPSAIKEVFDDMKSWAESFKCSGDNVKQAVLALKENPLLPADLKVAGFVINPDTGKLTEV